MVPPSVRDAFTHGFDEAAVLTNDTDLVEPIRIVTREVGDAAHAGFQTGNVPCRRIEPRSAYPALSRPLPLPGPCSFGERKENLEACGLVRLQIIVAVSS